MTLTMHQGRFASTLLLLSNLMLFFFQSPIGIVTGMGKPAGSRSRVLWVQVWQSILAHHSTPCTCTAGILWVYYNRVSIIYVKVFVLTLCLYFTLPHTFPWSAHGVLMELPICVREVMYKFLCKWMSVCSTKAFCIGVGIA